MNYETVVSGSFIARPNRFIAKVTVDGREETVHVVNTGRMKELLLPGAKVFLAEGKNPARKTKYDLVGVRSGDIIVNIDSFAPNKLAAEYIPTLFPGVTLIKPETVFGNSRFDFYAEDNNDKIFLEVKGVTLRVGDKAKFPDAPTERGTKHLLELIEAKKAGFRAAVLFVVAREDAVSFSPNEETDPAFAAALQKAVENGVEAYALSCRADEASLTAKKLIPVLPKG